MSHLHKISFLSSPIHSFPEAQIPSDLVCVCVCVCFMLLKLNWWFKAAQSNQTSETLVFICLSTCDFITTHRLCVHLCMCVCVCVCSSHLIPFISAILEFTAGVWGCSASLVRCTRPSRSRSTPDWWHYLYRSRGHNIKSGTWACVCVCVCVWRAMLFILAKAACLDAECNGKESWTLLVFPVCAQ